MTDGRPKTDPPTEAHDSNQLGGEEPAFYAAAAAVESLEVDLSDHAGSTSGVHGVGGSNVESESGAQSKADSAESSAKAYTDDHEDKPNPHGITVGKIGALASSDYNPESDTHSRYTDGEASNAAPVQSVNGATGNVSLETGVDATLVSSGKVDTFTSVAVVGSHSGQRTIPYAIELFNPESGNELTTVFDVGSNGDTSATYLTTVSPAGAENDHRYAVFELTL